MDRRDFGKFASAIGMACMIPDRPANVKPSLSAMIDVRGERSWQETLMLFSPNSATYGVLCLTTTPMDDLLTFSAFLRDHNRASGVRLQGPVCGDDMVSAMHPDFPGFVPFVRFASAIESAKLSDETRGFRIAVVIRVGFAMEKSLIEDCKKQFGAGVVVFLV